MLPFAVCGLVLTSQVASFMCHVINVEIGAMHGRTLRASQGLNPPSPERLQARIVDSTICISGPKVLQRQMWLHKMTQIRAVMLEGGLEFKLEEIHVSHWD